MRVLVPSLTCVAALCLMAGPAAAKAGLEVSAVPVTVGGVPTDEVSVTARGGDDAAGYQRLQAFVQRAASDSETFRAELQRVTRDGKGNTRTAVDLTSSPVRLPAAGAADIDASDAPLSLDDLVGLVFQQ